MRIILRRRQRGGTDQLVMRLLALRALTFTTEEVVTMLLCRLLQALKATVSLSQLLATLINSQLGECRTLRGGVLLGAHPTPRGLDLATRRAVKDRR